MIVAWLVLGAIGCFVMCLMIGKALGLRQYHDVVDAARKVRQSWRTVVVEARDVWKSR